MGEAKSEVRSFEDLNVYTQARALANGVYEATRAPGFARDRGLVDQIRRAAVSIMSNIAEGFERDGNAEFMQFLYIAKGSAGEVRAQLAIALDQNYMARATHDGLTDRCRRIGGMLGNLIAYLRGSRYQGAKYKKPPRKTMAEEVEEIRRRVQRGTTE